MRQQPCGLVVIGAPAPVASYAAVLVYVEQEIAQRRPSPSLRQIATHFGTSTRQATRLLARLERDGRLTRLPAGPRQRRPIVLPDERERAIATLRALGWAINGDARTASPPAAPARGGTDWRIGVDRLLSQIDDADEEHRSDGTGEAG